ncbi:MAG: holo-ACP synthase [Proteobacteria bacterium]|nr:holo-ACP synthase [Pseudomonadota bacterium]
MTASVQGIDALTQAVRGQRPTAAMRVGIDAVAVSEIERSLASFGDRFVQRMFTPHEIHAAKGSAERLAARFAAKEAAIKAFDMPEAAIDWRNIELRSEASGRPSLHLYGPALASARALGTEVLSVSLAHEQGMAIAIVIGVPENNSPRANTASPKPRARKHGKSAVTNHKSQINQQGS